MSFAKKVSLFPLKEAADTGLAWLGPVATAAISAYMGGKVAGMPGLLIAGGLAAVFAAASQKLDIAKMIAKSPGVRVLGNDHPTTMTVHNLARRHGMNIMPKVAIKEPEKGKEKKLPFAGAAGNHESSIVLVSPDLSSQISPREEQGILAHEVEHIWEEDTNLKLMVMAAGLPAGLIWKGYMLWMVASVLPVIGAPSTEMFFTALAANLARKVVAAQVSQAKERRADRGAVEITQNPWALSSGLQRVVEMHINALPTTSGRSVLRADRSMLSKVSERLFASHPPTSVRHKKFKHLAEELYRKFPDQRSALDQIRRETIAEIEATNVRLARKTKYDHKIAEAADRIARLIVDSAGRGGMRNLSNLRMRAAFALYAFADDIEQQARQTPDCAPAIHARYKTDNPVLVRSDAYETPARRMPIQTASSQGFDCNPEPLIRPA